MSDEPVREEQEMITEDDLYDGEQEVVESEEFEQEPETVSTQETPREDWRVQALRDDPSVRERFDRALFGGQDQAAPEPQVDPVQEAQTKLNELNSNVPTLDENNMTAEDVTRFMNWQRERDEARAALYDAKLQRQEQVLMQQQGRSALEDYIQRAKQSDPDFKHYEKEFRQYVNNNNIDPRLRQNQEIMDTLRGRIGYEWLQKNRRKAKAPGAPPVDEAYAQQGRAAKARKQADENALHREVTEQDRQIAAFYRMSPEEYVRGEVDYSADSRGAALTGAFNFSDANKLRRAGFEKYIPREGN